MYFYAVGETRVRRISSEFDESRKGSTLNLWDCQSNQHSHSYPVLPDNLYPPINEVCSAQLSSRCFFR